MAQHNELGEQGERAAAEYLKSKGYRIVCQNWRFHHYEIDIIARNADWIVFVEVKTRTSTQWGNPEDFVGKTRMRRMIEAADFYLKDNAIDDDVRFDIIGVVWNGHDFQIEHIEDAFLAFI